MKAKARRSILPILGIVALMICGLALWSSPRNEAQIINSQSQPAANTPMTKRYDGRYSSFAYSSMYTAAPIAAHDSDLELAMFTANTNYQKNLALDISQMPAEGLQGITAQRLRQSQPENYALTKIVIEGQSAMQWARRDGNEITVIIPHGNVYATLAFTTSDNTSDLPREVTQLLSTYHWN